MTSTITVGEIWIMYAAFYIAGTALRWIVFPSDRAIQKVSKDISAIVKAAFFVGLLWWAASR